MEDTVDEEVFEFIVQELPGGGFIAQIFFFLILAPIVPILYALSFPRGASSEEP